MSNLGQIAGELPARQSTRWGSPIARADGLKAPHLSPSERGLHGRAAFLQKTMYRLGRSLVAAYMRFMLDVDIQWHAPLAEGPKILAANHPTTTDPFFILTLLREPVSVLVTAACFEVPIFGSYLRAAGHVPAVRGSGGATVEAMVRQVEDGRSVAIFPEGALSPLAGGFHQPHSGVARVALTTGAPVIPVGIGLQRHRIHATETEVGSDKATGHFYPSGPYAMTVGRPLRFRGDVCDRECVRAAAAHIMDQIRYLAGESQRRIRTAPEPLARPQPGASAAEAR